MRIFGNNFLSFIEARKIIISLGLKSTIEWKKYARTKREKNIPSSPDVVYKNKGWVSWNDWLGTNNKIGCKLQRKYIFNENFFKVWSHDMAYILGFWFADGCISKKYEFNLMQHSSDKYLLEIIRKKMGSNHLFHKCGNCISFYIYSKSIVEDIKNLGGKERKSLDVDFPNIPKEFLLDFVRGYFDGDGRITYKKYGKNYICVCGFTCGSKLFIKKLYAVLKQEIKTLRGSLFKRTRKITIDRIINGGIIKRGIYVSYELQFSKNDAIKLRKFMYNNDGCICLERKRKIFFELGEISKHIFGFLDYNEAKIYAHSLKLLTKKQWINYFIINKKQANIPISPQLTYKNKGWVSWKEWLGFRELGKGRWKKRFPANE